MTNFSFRSFLSQLSLRTRLWTSVFWSAPIFLDQYFLPRERSHHYNNELWEDIFDAVYIAYRYENDFAKMIHNFKYLGQRDIMWSFSPGIDCILSKYLVNHRDEEVRFQNSKIFFGREKLRNIRPISQKIDVFLILGMLLCLLLGSIPIQSRVELFVWSMMSSQAVLRFNLLLIFFVLTELRKLLLLFSQALWFNDLISPIFVIFLEYVWSTRNNQCYNT